MKYKSALVSCIICRCVKSAKGIFTHYKQSHDTEWKSSWMTANTQNSAVRNKTATDNRHTKLSIKTENYKLSPKICICCNNILSYNNRKNMFCNNVCAAKFNNSKRYGSPINHVSKEQIPKFCPVSFKKCKICNNIMYTRKKTNNRKTCSRECRIHASVGNRTYTNGRRLNIYYFNKNSNETVLLESSWEKEIAEFLDARDIKWIRPNYIKWTDINGKLRLYYADFFLPDFNLYLDPKNPTAMSTSVDKMIAVSKIIQLIYGDKDMIKEYIVSEIKLVTVGGIEPPSPGSRPVSLPLMYTEIKTIK